MLMGRDAQVRKLKGSRPPASPFSDDERLARVLDGFPRLSRLSLNWMKPNEATLVRLSEVQGLRHLTLAGEITDAWLEQVTRIPRLNSLTLSGSVDDRGVALLARCPELEEVDLSGTRSLIPDGLLALERLPHLRRLGLASYPLRAVARCLSRLRGLESLSIRGPGAPIPVLDEADQPSTLWKAVGAMPRLRTLRLSPVGADDLSAVSALCTVEELELAGVYARDGALLRLRDMPRLRVLKVTTSNFPPARLAKLRRELPALEIQTD
jgi:hypothetical protein